MKLLFICESFPTSAKADFTGGVEARDFYVAKELAHDNSVKVITNKRQGIKDRQSITNIKVIRVGQETSHRNREDARVRISFFFSSLASSLKQDFDIVQGSNAFTQLIAFLVGVLERRPKVALIPDIYAGEWVKNTNLVTGTIGEIIERLVLKLPFNVIVSWSQSTKKKLESFGVNSPIKVITGGVDFGKCQQLKVKKYKQPTIIFAARLVHYKKASDLIKAASLVKNTIPNIQVKIIGSGPERSKLKRQVGQLKLKPNVNFLGFIQSHTEVLKTIKRSHLFCLPSVVEGFGLVTVEAMACGVPFVNSKIPPTLEVTQRGRGGLLFTPEDTDQLAEMITRLLSNDKLYAAKVDEGVKLAQKYSWSQIGKQTQKLFRTLLPR